MYNAWLAQLVEHHQIAGLTIVRQWDNVLLDLMLLHLGNAFGFVAAEKIAVSFAVLVFFWACFSFLAEASGRPPWLLTPLLMMFAYGYAFHMGFMNYYLSIGLAFFVLALAWRGGAGNWLFAVPLCAASFIAHPIGPLVAVSLAGYIWIWRRMKGWVRFSLPVVTVVCFVLLRLFLTSHDTYQAGWRSSEYFQLFGQDQVDLFGRRYGVLSWVVLAWAAVCVVAALYDWVMRARKPSPFLRLAAEIYIVAILVTACLPENVRVSIYAGWVGLLVSRLTLVTAIFGLLILASLRLPRWAVYGNVLCAAVFFVFLYQDTGKLDRLEASARAVAQTLPIGARIVAVANPPEDWRIQFIYHSIDRACIGRCFSYANYEASSLQFRVRALPGNYYVTTSVDQSDDLSSGDYVVRQKDLPLTSIYQCDESDFTQLCALPLRAGQKTEDPESEPAPAVPAHGDSDSEN
ncbi:MAG TPA: hypothetical protein VGF20_09180 [Candidatus Acidoferrum sp.]